MTTPAQASGYPDFVTDWPVQGPTDPGIRAHDCWFAQNRLPAQPACVDCKGPIPMWAQTGLSEQVSFGGRAAPGFALGNINDPDIWSKLSSDQQMWVSTALNKMNDLIVKQSGTTCPTWGPAINLAGGCFQTWFNANYGAANSGVMTLRTDGAFDQDTLCALIMVTSMPANATALALPAFPDPSKQFSNCSAKTAASTKKLSTAAMLGIGGAGVALLGGIIYAASHHKGGRRSRR